MNKQLYGRTFFSKREFMKWLEENEDKIDWDYGVEIGWYWENEE